MDTQCYVCSWLSHDLGGIEGSGMCKVLKK